MKSSNLTIKAFVLFVTEKLDYWRTDQVLALEFQFELTLVDQKFIGVMHSNLNVTNAGWRTHLGNSGIHIFGFVDDISHIK